MIDWQPGTSVRVKNLMPPGHVRTPYYLRGKIGIVERVLGPFPNPEGLAYGHTPDSLPLFRVRFTMQEVWGSQAEQPSDTIEAEIYAHWLEKVED